MSLNIGVEVWFACKSCNTSFLKLGDFIQHKKKDHFEEFKNTRCIVLEERTVSTSNLDSDDENDEAFENCVSNYLATTKEEADSVEAPETDDDPFQGIEYTSLNEAATTAQYQSNLSQHLNLDADDAISLSDINDDYEPPFESCSNILPNQLSDSNAEVFNKSQDVAVRTVAVDEINSTSTRFNQSRKTKSKNPYVTIKRLTKKQICQNAPHGSRSDPGLNDADIIAAREYKKQFLKKFEISSVPAQLQSDPNLECKLCHSKFGSDQELSAHVDICWFDNKTKHSRRYCVLCHKLFGNPGALEEHLLRSHMTESEKNQAKEFQCPVCPMKFFKGAERRVHMESHKNKEERPRSFVCLICGFAFYRNFQLTQHYKTHSDQRPFKCHVAGCGLAFISNFNLKGHVFYTHNSKGKVRYKCPDPKCSKTLKYKYDIEKHVRAVHRGERPHKCTQANCDQSFQLSSQLIRHKQSSHC